MSDLRLFLDPADTYLIRDGRPFNQIDTGQSRANSRFPPPPDSLYGAARVAVARALGWSGQGDWGPDIARHIGSWATETGVPFAISGPYFELDGELLLQVPAHAFLVKQGTALMTAKPAASLDSDKGSVRFLGVPIDATGLAGRWAPAGAVQELIGGGVIPPDQLRLARHGDYWPKQGQGALPGYSEADLAPVEARVGLERNALTRLATDGMLYASGRRAHRPGVRMFAILQGVAPEAAKLPVAIQFGSEARFAFLERQDGTVLPSHSQREVMGQYTVMLTTPAQLPALDGGATVSNLPGTLACAAVAQVAATARMIRSGPTQWGTEASTLTLPAGSVLFMDTPSGAGTLPEAIGENTHRGYGRYIVGTW